VPVAEQTEALTTAHTLLCGPRWEPICPMRAGHHMEGRHLVTATIFAPQALIVILLLALILFGWKKFPEVASGLGTAMHEFHG
jgi:TatA/E family protein of Tat protein translocase